MKARIVARIALSLVVGFTLVLVQPARAQEGHPMAGSWVGDGDEQRISARASSSRWSGQGKELTATINPGPNAIKAKTVKVNPVDWSVHIEADGKDAQGRAVVYVIDGKIDDLGTYNRSIIGTWNSGTVKGDFSITRQ